MYQLTFCHTDGQLSVYPVRASNFARAQQWANLFLSYMLGLQTVTIEYVSTTENAS